MLFGPVLNDVHYVTGAGSDTQIRFAALLEFLLIVANIGSAVVLYPLVRRGATQLTSEERTMMDERIHAKSMAEEDAEWRNPANWHGGPLGLYFSRRDPRAFVPKRSGLGATINFARPIGVGFLVGILGFVALMFVLTRGTSR